MCVDVLEDARVLERLGRHDGRQRLRRRRFLLADWLRCEALGRLHRDRRRVFLARVRLVLFLWFGGSMRRDRHAAILLPVVVVGAATAGGGALTERVALLVRSAGCSCENSVTSLVIALNAVNVWFLNVQNAMYM